MLEIRNLRKAFGDLQVLKGIDLDVNKGDVVEAGSHEELLKTCVPYREISEAQMGGEAV